MNKNLKLEEFIQIYRTCLANNISINDLSFYLDIREKSILKRRSDLKRLTGLDLPFLKKSEKVNLGIVSKIPSLLEEFNKKYSQSATSDQPISFKEHIRKRYVITSAQNATPIDDSFFTSLLTYCEKNDAELMIAPYRYKNPTSLWTQNNQDDDWWNIKIQPYLVNNDIDINNGLILLGSIKIQPTASDPLSGMDGYTGIRSCILAHPRIRFKTVATPNNILPKILTTTGSVTVKNYTDSKIGYKGRFHHSIGALIVETDGDIFHIRHIISDEDGSFYDLDEFYHKNIVTSNNRIAALVTGDSHAEFMDERVEEATYTGEKSIRNILNPEKMVFHDILDFYNRNHHHRNNDLLSYGKFKYGEIRDSVEKNLQIAADFIDRVSSPNSLNIIVRSNHDEAFDRWLRETDIKNDPQNAKFYHYMKYNQLKYLKSNDVGFETINPFEFWCSNPDEERGLCNVQETIFLPRNESFVIKNIEVGLHGDIGVNGARGNVKSLDTIGSKSIIGHSHSPQIYGGCYQVGISAKLNLEYSIGPSAWLHTHCIIYPNGKRTLINVIKGKWTTKY